LVAAVSWGISEAVTLFQSTAGLKGGIINLSVNINAVTLRDLLERVNHLAVSEFISELTEV
jgi:hypothetical protein